MSELWAITSYYNPARYRRRRLNYLTFREQLDVPLLAVELGLAGDFELADADADVLVRVHDGDVLWQKERLLDIALQHLPANCRYVAWLDADVVFLRLGWAQHAVETLATTELVQLFERVLHLPPDALDGAAPREALAEMAASTLHGDARARAMTACCSAAARVAGGVAPRQALSRVTDRTAGAPSPGMAWAASRQLLERHRWYDGCVVGGGDTALACAAWGLFDVAVELHKMNPCQTKRYLEWGRALHESVRGNVGVLPGELLHLWHGSMAARRPSLRHAELARFSFDPARDLRLGRDGCWRWASDKPALHQYVRDYFWQRREDELAAASVDEEGV